ncbi:MAG: HEAT repeat domain-containing protein [Planctomycetota bacterium]
MLRRYLLYPGMLTLLLAIFAAPFVSAQDDESVQAIFDKGLREFKEGRYGYDIQNVAGHRHGALYYFDLVKRRIGGMDDAAQRAALTSLLISQAGYGVMMRVLRAEHEDGNVQTEMQSFARWLMAGEARAVEVRWDPDEIVRKLHIAMRDPDSAERLRTMEVIAVTFGEFAVPEIHRHYLHCANDELEGRAMFLLTRIGRNSVMPLIELMDSANPRDRQHAAHVLGDLNDSRAVPVLVEHAKAQWEEENVKRECKIALEAILGPIRNVGDLIDAKKYYYSLSLKYYHQVPELIYGRTDAFVTWRWVPRNLDQLKEGGHLDFDDNIPIWAYMDVQAEEAALDALMLDEKYQEAWDLLLDINARQYIEASAREVYAVHDKEDDPDAAEELDGDTGFGAVFNRAHRGRVLVGGGGQLLLYRAIQRALIDRLPEVAVQVIEKLMVVGDARYIPHDEDYDARTGRLNKEGAPLIEALTYDDKRVRYAAAQALFTLNNNRIQYRNPNYDPNTPGSSRMIGFTGFYGIATARNIVIQGLGESAQRTILVISDNLDLKNNMRRVLESLGYYAYFAETPADGLQRALTFPADDLIIIDAKIANSPIRTWVNRRDSFRNEDFSDFETIFDVLADDFRTRKIPICLMADPEQTPFDNLKGTGGIFEAEFNEGRLLSILPFHNNAIDPVEADLGTFQDVWQTTRLASKDRANHVAIGCATAIREWDPDRAPAGFFNPVIQALVARVHDPRRNTEVKVEMLKTLEQFCQAKDDTLYPVEFWNRDVIPNLLPVLTSNSEVDEPIVKYWACRVLTAVYLNRRGGFWRAFDPASDADRPPPSDEGAQPDPSTGTWAQDPFWVLFTLLDYHVRSDTLIEGANLEDMTEARRARYMVRMQNLRDEIRAVREAAAEVMGAAPMSELQRRYVFQHKRINRKVPNKYPQ